MDYIDKTMKRVEETNCKESSNFFQALKEVLESIEPLIQNHPEYERYNIIERIILPQ